MRISVECGGFTQAADACRTANQTAALLTESLASRLAGSAGMAGDDSTSAAFARSYDAGAPEAFAALTDLTHALVGAGRLLFDTGRAHEVAEAAAAGMRVSAYAGDSLADSFVRVAPSPPPSSLGSQESSPGVVDRWILDQVEGFVWPGADIDGLRAAGTAWRRAAGSTAGLADHLDVAATFLGHQRSPEVPLALDALEDLGTLVGDTAWQLSSLASACDEYATAVEETRERTRALLREVAQMAVEGVAMSAIASAVGAGSVAAAAAAERVRRVAPRFLALLAAFRSAAAAAAVRIDRALDELRAIRVKIDRFLHIPARNEVGAASNPLGWGMQRPGRPKPVVADQRLRNYVDQLFKGIDNPRRTGDGTTMDAIRHELQTGGAVHGRRHIQKGQDVMRGLNRWLREHPEASDSDRALAQSLVEQLEEALTHG